MSNFNDAFKNVRKLLLKATAEVRAKKLKSYMDEGAESIKRRTRLGFGVKRDGQPRQKLKPLSDIYKQRRKKDKKSGKLSSKTSPGKSNLTRTGQMLDSIKGKKTSKGKGEIFFKEQRKGESITNSEVADHVEEGGRPFFYLTDLETKRITDRVRKDLTASVEKALRKLR